MLGPESTRKLFVMEDRPFSERRTAPLTAVELWHFGWALPPLAVLLVANLLFELAGGGYARAGAQLLATTAPGDDIARTSAQAAAAIN